MARKPAGTQLVNWEEELATQAAVATETLRSGGSGGAFFSLKAGQLTFGGNAMPGNQMAVIILASIIENSYYDTPYDPDKPSAPRCFAFAEREADLEPHEAVDQDDYFERQSATCAECPQNEWGSARQGRGKACSNVMRLEMIPAGVYKLNPGRNAGMALEMYDDPDHFAKVESAFMKLPVMSVKGFSGYVRQLSTDLARPPHGVFTNVSVVPDAKSQFRVEFELIDNVPSTLLPIIMPRHKRSQEAIGFPYTPPPEDEAPVENKLKKPAPRKR